MKEHTITTMRQLLSNQDTEMLSALKDKEQHKYRDLMEVRGRQLKTLRVGGKLITKEKIHQAASEIGMDPQRAEALLLGHPEMVFNPKFLGAQVSRMLGVPNKTMQQWRDASPLERIGGPIGTAAWKLGRAAEKAEKWLHFTPAEQRQTISGYAAREQTAGSAFGPAANIDRTCIGRFTITPRGRPAIVGPMLGSDEYYRCRNDPTYHRYWKDFSHAEDADKVPELVSKLGLEPDRYMQQRKQERFKHKYFKFQKKAGRRHYR